MTEPTDDQIAAVHKVLTAPAPAYDGPTNSLDRMNLLARHIAAAVVSAAPVSSDLEGDEGSLRSSSFVPTELEDGPVFFSKLRTANLCRQGEWDKDGGIDAAYRGNELAGEVGEACNVIKKLERERRGIRGSRATVQELSDELADVVICTDLIAMQYGIDLDDAVERKFNATSVKVGLLTRLKLGGDEGASPNEPKPLTLEGSDQ